MPTALARIRPVLVPGAALALALTLALARPAGAAAQADPFNFPFSSGQAVAPFFDGWSRNPDGTYALHFGYINRNHVEELHLPVGADNRFESGGIDQGQPTFFYPRVHCRTSWRSPCRPTTTACRGRAAHGGGRAGKRRRRRSSRRPASPERRSTCRSCAPARDRASCRSTTA